MAGAKRTIETLAPFQGRDLRLDYALRMGFFEDADLSPGRTLNRGVERDLGLVDGIDNLTQAIANRLKTRRGELAALGHPNYGSRHHELIGQPNVDRTRNLIKLYILQALRDEPRVERVLSAKVRAEQDPPRDTVRVELELLVLGAPNPLSLVLPFSLGVAL
jgi:phage baseplate assembly protein W